MKTIHVQPSLDAMPQVSAFVEEMLEEAMVPMKVMMQFGIAADEMFSNIAYYSAATQASVTCGVQDGKAVLCFSDNGIAYDPTAQPDPDTSLSAEERGVGGLGIFMVRKSMDEMRYERTGENNVLTLIKNI